MIKKNMRRVLTVLISLSILISCCVPFTALGANESEIRNKVVSVAKNEVGYTGTSTTSKYGDWYGYQGGWCTTFVLWCFNQTGSALDITLNGKIIPSGGNCNSMISWFKNKGRYHEASENYTPSAGDLVFFDWSGNDSSQHVGIINYVSGSTVYTIEGNCSGKVKAREYTKNGSKPYNNISSIMGYASPNYSSVAGSSSTTNTTTTKKTTTSTTKKSTTKKTTTKKSTATTTKKATTTTTKKSTTATKRSTTSTTQKSTTASTTQETTTAETTTEQTTELESENTLDSLDSLEIYASTYELQIGDSVELQYTVEPADAQTVVGYFCDEEGVIEIGYGGEITAVGTGTATVVVCANDDLYNQCDFTVIEAQGDVTKVEQNTTRKVVGTANNSVVTTEQNIQSTLTRMGVNVTALEQNKQLFAIPIAIIFGTAVISVFVAVTKKTKAKKKNK
ncbi:MAG: CHAP domain-containing protein [Clostridiales bacterium]|nr:CHAP domain-containing protein [Clostridiales bacterium]